MKLPWEEIEELTKYMKENQIFEVCVETKEGKISLKKDSGERIISSPKPIQVETSNVALKEAAKPKSNLFEVTAPMVGTFYGAPSPGAEPFIKVGSQVKKGDVLCIIEAMKIMNELPSDVSGTVQEILATDTSIVEYGQVIIRIAPN